MQFVRSVENPAAGEHSLHQYESASLHACSPDYSILVAGLEGVECRS